MPITYLILYLNQFLTYPSFINIVGISLIFALIGFFITYKMTITFMPMTLKSGLKGIDINKCEDVHNLKDPNRKEVPESLGIVPATVFLLVTIIFQIFLQLDNEQQLQYNASLLSISFMTFLGFADDVVDLKWRYKLFLPLIASFPLIFAYSGATNIIMPNFIFKIIGIKSIELGIIYKVYMCLLSIFCTNSINIYAGINGLEVGQSLIISLTIILYNLIEIIIHDGQVEENLFSMSIMIPFFTCSLGLFMFNKYPSLCFIGDTYCYFAGMTFACAGIHGHFSKSILLFFIPQILNFLFSFPQLIGIVPCSRHRLPKYDHKTRLLTGQKEHWNLLNVSLRVLGPKREQDLCNILLIFQIICSTFALFIRFTLFKII
jgi:UDP-N-acetylglucosamine--dolichyl-phosphate N-acetylglucosaminephosphotransferase